MDHLLSKEKECSYKKFPDQDMFLFSFEGSRKRELRIDL